MKTIDTAEHSQVLTFFIANDEYAIGILKVKEIIEYETPTRVPSAPVCVAGVINLRGTVVPVVDLAVKFGLPPSEVTKRTCFIIVEAQIESEELVMGVLADSVSEVIDLTASEVEPPPNFGTRVRSDFLLGMVRSGRKFILLLDMDRTLASVDVVTLPAASAEGAAAAEAPVS